MSFLSAILFWIYLLLSHFALLSWAQDQCETGVTISPGDILASSTIGISNTGSGNGSLEFTRCADGNIVNSGTAGIWFWYWPDGETRNLSLSTCHPIDTDDTTTTTTPTVQTPHRITVFSAEVSLDETENGSIDKSLYCTGSQACMATSDTVDPDCPHENSTLLAPLVVSSAQQQPNHAILILVHDQAADTSGEFVLTLTDISNPPDNNGCDTIMEMEQNQTIQGTTVGATTLFMGSLPETSTSALQSCLFASGDVHPGVFYHISTPVVSEPSNVTVTVTGATKTFEFVIFHVTDIVTSAGALTCSDLSCSHVLSTSVLHTTIQNGTTTSTTWLAETSHQDYYVYVYAMNMGEKDPVTGRFGIQWSMRTTSDDDDDDGTDGSGGLKATCSSLWLFLLLCQIMQSVCACL